MLTRPLLAALSVAALLGVPALALTRHELNEAGFHLRPGTPMPADAVLRGAAGETTLGLALAGKPALLVFTDYRCQSLCGLVLDQLAGALPHVALTLGRDYNVLSVSLDAAQTPADAAAFRDAHAGGGALRDSGLFFANPEASLQALRASVGLVAPFDVAHRQFAHPAGLVLVDAGGRAQRVLSPFGLDPLNLKLALTEGGAAPSLAAHALLLCYGWDAVAGLYTLRIERVLMLAAAATIALIACGLALLVRRERRTHRAPVSKGSRP